LDWGNGRGKEIAGSVASFTTVAKKNLGKKKRKGKNRDLLGGGEGGTKTLIKKGKRPRFIPFLRKGPSPFPVRRTRPGGPTKIWLSKKKALPLFASKKDFQERKHPPVHLFSKQRRGQASTASRGYPQKYVLGKTKKTHTGLWGVKRGRPKKGNLLFVEEGC